VLLECLLAIFWLAAFAYLANYVSIVGPAINEAARGEAKAVAANQAAGITVNLPSLIDKNFIRSLNCAKAGVGFGCILW